MGRFVKIKQNLTNPYHFSKFLYKAETGQKNSARKLLFFFIDCKGQTEFRVSYSVCEAEVVNATHCADRFVL